MAGVLRHIASGLAGQHRANTLGDLAGCGGVVALGRVADRKVVQAHAPGLVHQRVVVGKFAPCIVDRGDDALVVQQRDMGRQRIEDGRLLGRLGQAQLVLGMAQQEGAA
jgi:hypothetical protein